MFTTWSTKFKNEFGVADRVNAFTSVQQPGVVQTPRTWASTAGAVNLPVTVNGDEHDVVYRARIFVVHGDIVAFQIVGPVGPQGQAAHARLLWPGLFVFLYPVLLVLLQVPAGAQGRER